MSDEKNSIQIQNNVKVALQAWRALAEGHRTGNFADYLVMLTEDYTFFMPIGEFRGKNVGRTRAAECYRQISAANPKLVFKEPINIAAAQQTVVIEFEDEGTLSGMPYRNRIAGSFDVRGEQICGYREYFGEIDPKLVQMMAESA